jgi:hypothetical protein
MRDMKINGEHIGIAIERDDNCANISHSNDSFMLSTVDRRRLISGWTKSSADLPKSWSLKPTKFCGNRNDEQFSSAANQRTDPHKKLPSTVNNSHADSQPRGH